MNRAEKARVGKYTLYGGAQNTRIYDVPSSSPESLEGTGKVGLVELWSQFHPQKKSRERSDEC